MKQKDYAALWNTQAQNTAVDEGKELAGEINLDGFEFIGRRLPMQRWIRAGRVPQSLTAQMIRISRGEQNDVDENELSTDELIAAQKFVVDTICYVVKVPTIVTHANRLNPGEVRYSEIFDKRPDLIDKIMSWVFKNQPGIPVKTKGGQTSVEAVSNFPSTSERSASSSSRNEVSKVRRQAERRPLHP